MRFDGTAPWNVRLTQRLRDLAEPIARAERREPAELVRLAFEQWCTQRAIASGRRDQNAA